MPRSLSGRRSVSRCRVRRRRAFVRRRRDGPSGSSSAARSSTCTGTRSSSARASRAARRKTAAVVQGLARWTPEDDESRPHARRPADEARRLDPCSARDTAERPNRLGPARMLSDWKEVRTRLVVDRRRLTATLYRRGKVVFQRRWAWACRTGRRRAASSTSATSSTASAIPSTARSRSGRARARRSDRLAGRWVHRTARDESAVAPSGASPRLHPAPERRHILRLARLMPVGTPLTVR